MFTLITCQISDISSIECSRAVQVGSDGFSHYTCIVFLPCPTKTSCFSHKRIIITHYMHTTKSETKTSKELCIWQLA